MIRTKFYIVEPEGSIHMVMWGHAGAAPRGQDLVCAGCSTLACTLGEAVERLYQQGMLRRYPRVEIKAGEAEIIALPKPAFFQEVMMLFWLAETGIGLLNRNYPDYVSLEEAMKMHRKGDGI